jgi:Ca-activated chloride channel family protein
MNVGKCWRVAAVALLAGGCQRAAEAPLPAAQPVAERIPEWMKKVDKGEEGGMGKRFAAESALGNDSSSVIGGLADNSPAASGSVDEPTTRAVSRSGVLGVLGKGGGGSGYGYGGLGLHGSWSGAMGGRAAMVGVLRATVSAEAYARQQENDFRDVEKAPLSTFSVDVDTASYSNVRRFLNGGQLPPVDAVRIEEMINYFPYAYQPPAADAKEPFASNVEVADCPWAPKHRLLRIGVKGREIDPKQRPASNLTFLIDVSGSMMPDNKLPLLKRSLALLVETLDARDQVSMVVYAGTSGVVLPPTRGDEQAKIHAALDRLEAGGSTNGGQGIELAYRLASQHFIRGGSNRVILATDGDFNVGITNESELVRLIQAKAKTGVFLSVLGFGMGNTKDSTMEKLADKGNGNYAYIDTLQEGRKVLVEQMTGTLITIAKDVKLQVAFDPTRVKAYRQVGYENRQLRAEDFANDKIDAGEIGAGHTVTALYELDPVEGGPAGELATVKIRFKPPAGDTSRLSSFPVNDARASFANASVDFKLAASVAEFGMLLRSSKHRGSASWNQVLELARAGQGSSDPNGHRAELLSLAERAARLYSASARRESRVLAPADAPE